MSGVCPLCLDESNFEAVKAKILEVDDESLIVKVVHRLIIALRLRPKAVHLLVRLAVEISMEKPQFRNQFMSEIEPECERIENELLFLEYSLFRAGLISFEFLQPLIEQSELLRPFCWFAKEYDQVNSYWLDKRVNHFLKTHKRREQATPARMFCEQMDELYENDWELLERLRNEGNLLVEAIRRDDIEFIQRVCSESPGILGSFCNSIFNRHHLEIDRYPIEIAALFGSVKSFKFFTENDHAWKTRPMKLTEAACIGGNSEIIGILYENGLLDKAEAVITSALFERPDLVSSFGDVDIDWTRIFRECCQSEALEMIELCLKHEIGIELIQEMIFVCSSLGKIEALQRLLQCPGVDVNYEVVARVVDTNEIGDPPAQEPLNCALVVAVARNRYDVVRLLFHVDGIDVNHKSGVDDPPIFVAVTLNSSRMLGLFLSDERVNVNAQNSSGNTPLVATCADGNMDKFRALLACPRVDINCPNAFGNTPVMVAAYYGHTEIVAALCELPNIDLTHTNTYDETALDRAKETWHHAAVKIIEEHM